MAAAEIDDATRVDDCGADVDVDRQRVQQLEEASRQSLRERAAALGDAAGIAAGSVGPSAASTSIASCTYRHTVATPTRKPAARRV